MILTSICGSAVPLKRFRWLIQVALPLQSPLFCECACTSRAVIVLTVTIQLGLAPCMRSLDQFEQVRYMVRVGDVIDIQGWLDSHSAYVQARNTASLEHKSRATLLVHTVQLSRRWSDSNPGTHAGCVFVLNMCASSCLRCITHVPAHQARRTFAILLRIPARPQPQKQLSHCRIKCLRVNQKMRLELPRLILPLCASFGTCVVYVALLHHRSSKHGAPLHCQAEHVSMCQGAQLWVCAPCWCRAPSSANRIGMTLSVNAHDARYAVVSCAVYCDRLTA